MPMLCADLPLGAPCGVGLHGAHVVGSWHGHWGSKALPQDVTSCLQDTGLQTRGLIPKTIPATTKWDRGGVGTWSPLWHQFPT